MPTLELEVVWPRERRLYLITPALLRAEPPVKAVVMRRTESRRYLISIIYITIK